jgi:hypothetical protein
VCSDCGHNETSLRSVFPCILYTIPITSKKPTSSRAVPTTPHTPTTQQPSWIAAQQHNKTGCTAPHAVKQVYAPDDGRRNINIVTLLHLVGSLIIIGTTKQVSLFRRKISERYIRLVGQDSTVGIATGYGLDGPVIESLWGRDFPHLSRPALGHTQPPVKLVTGLSRW